MLDVTLLLKFLNFEQMTIQHFSVGESSFVVGGEDVGKFNRQICPIILIINLDKV